MKKIYIFTLNKEIETEEPQLSKNDKGEEVKTLVKVKKPETHNYFLRQLNRKIEQDQELFVAEVIAECDRRGIFRRVSIQKRYLNDGDILSVEQRKAYEKAKDLLFEKQSEYFPLNNKKDKTKEEIAQAEKLTSEIFDILTEIQSFESKLDDELYQFTAENVAQNRLIVWQTLMLSYEEKNGKEIPVFGEGSYEDKLKKYDELKELDDEFLNKLFDRLQLIISLKTFGKAQTQEEFDIAIKYFENKDLIQAAEVLTKTEILPEIKEEPKEKPKEKEEVEIKYTKVEEKKEDKNEKERAIETV